MLVFRGRNRGKCVQMGKEEGKLLEYALPKKEIV